MKNKIAVIGAGNVGATCAMYLAEANIADIVLVDVVLGDSITAVAGQDPLAQMVGRLRAFI